MYNANKHHNTSQHARLLRRLILGQEMLTASGPRIGPLLLHAAPPIEFPAPCTNGEIARTADFGLRFCPPSWHVRGTMSLGEGPRMALTGGLCGGHSFLRRPCPLQMVDYPGLS